MQTKEGVRGPGRKGVQDITGKKKGFGKIVRDKEELSSDQTGLNPRRRADKRQRNTKPDMMEEKLEKPSNSN